MTLTPKARATLYSVYAVVGVALGAIQVGLQAAEQGFPVWLKVSLSVYAFLGTAFGFTAAVNTPTARHKES